MQNFQGSIFIWIRTYTEIFKSALVYLKVTNFSHKEILNVDSNHTCLTVVSLDFVLKKDESYYPQVFLREYKYINEKAVRHIIDDLESSSDEFDEE